MTWKFKLAQVFIGFVWHWLRIPSRWRELRDRQRLDRAFREFSALNGELSRTLNDHDFQFNVDEMLALTFSVALDRVHDIMGRYFAGMDTVVSIKTLDPVDPKLLRCWYPVTLPVHRIECAFETIPISGTIGGDAFRNSVPVCVEDISTRRESYGTELFAKYEDVIGSVLAWPIPTPQNQVVAVLKVDSPQKNAFTNNEPTQQLMRHASSVISLVFATGRQLAFRETARADESIDHPFMNDN